MLTVWRGRWRGRTRPRRAAELDLRNITRGFRTTAPNCNLRARLESLRWDGRPPGGLSPITRSGTRSGKR
eukprot:4713223-Lingulodinium_polyedra.AAC.1